MIKLLHLPGASCRAVQTQLKAVGVQQEALEEGGELRLPGLGGEVANQHRRSLSAAGCGSRLRRGGTAALG